MGYYQMIFNFGEIKLILLLKNFFLLELAVIKEISSILSEKKLTILNKFFSTPPSSIEGEKINNVFSIFKLLIVKYLNSYY